MTAGLVAVETKQNINICLSSVSQEIIYFFTPERELYLFNSCILSFNVPAAHLHKSVVRPLKTSAIMCQGQTRHTRTRTDAHTLCFCYRRLLTESETQCMCVFRGEEETFLSVSFVPCNE